jgi:hypothetical protein
MEQRERELEDMKADLASGVRNLSGNKDGAKMTVHEKKLLKNAINARIYRLKHRDDKKIDKRITNHEEWKSSSESAESSSDSEDIEGSSDPKEDSESDENYQVKQVASTTIATITNSGRVVQRP